MANKKVLVCSKNRLTLTALCLCTPILQSLVGGATTEDEALQVQQKNHPDILITSEDLESGYGIRLVEKAKNYSPELKALIFLQRETPEVVQEAMEAGADGVMFISSIGTGDGDFINALSTTNSGGIYYPRSVREAATAKVKSAPVLVDPLSERELDVIRCIIRGMRNIEIADALFISSETVKSHVSTVIQKLGVRDRTQAAVFAMTHGLIEAGI
ncbi:response regulator transcription factor [Synechococcus sp. CC9311]|uniref:helix-turn-helix transcriptional regulator n=1 Tax=Synechococcus sp. (strain CC9311) TaxID=64471 RepID=UPI001ED8DFF4|nr:response regulator transcription factor [Synechococcus sp. CC9311]